MPLRVVATNKPANINNPAQTLVIKAVEATGAAIRAATRASLLPFKTVAQNQQMIFRSKNTRAIRKRLQAALQALFHWITVKEECCGGEMSFFS